MLESTPPISILKKETYLLATFPPYESRRQWESQISALYDAVDQHNARKLLIDCRATRRQIPILDLFELCLYVVGKFGHMNPKIAVIASPEAVYSDRFGETVARNRGLDIIRFVDNEQEALDWLLKRKPASQH